jgi:hypothetical protein
MTTEIFRSENTPVFQNKMFNSELAARSCPAGDVVPAQDIETGLVSNVAFDPSPLDHDYQYQNEQSCAVVFQQHLDEVTQIIDRHSLSQGALLLRPYGPLDEARRRNVRQPIDPSGDKTTETPVVLSDMYATRPDLPCSSTVKWAKRLFGPLCVR